MNSAFLFAVALVISGCTGQVKEYLDDKDGNYASDPNDPKAEGIRVYMPALMMVTSETTTYTDPGSKIMTSSCTRVPSRRIETRPDYTRPLRIKFEGGPLNTYTFNVTLSSDGTLLGMNSQSTPPVASIAPLITSVTGAIATMSSLKSAEQTHKCNGSPEVVRIERCTAKGSVLCDVQ